MVWNSKSISVEFSNVVKTFTAEQFKFLSCGMVKDEEKKRRRSTERKEEKMKNNYITQWPLTHSKESIYYYVFEIIYVTK